MRVKCNLVFTFSRQEQENDAVLCVFMMPKLNHIYTCGIVFIIFIGLCWVSLDVRGRLKDKIVLSVCINKKSKAEVYTTF